MCIRDRRRVVCKHMIALYFTAEPEAAADFLRQVAEWEAEEEAQVQQHYEDLKAYVNSLSLSLIHILNCTAKACSRRLMYCRLCHV